MTALPAPEPVPADEVELLFAPTRLPADLAAEDDDELEFTGVQTLIDGKPVLALEGKPCEHRVAVARIVLGMVHAEPDGSGPIVRRELLVRARCGECGVPLRFLLGSAHQSLTCGELGVVVDVEALEE